jgi:thiol-disulfide isomerase/thioredoxin
VPLKVNFGMADTGTHFFLNGQLLSDVTTLSSGSAAMDWSTVLGPSLLTPEGEKPTSEVLKEKKKVALLFSGEWCPWCREFDPYFTDVMAKVRAKDPDDTEVVYMSVDADEAKMKAITSQKPWAAVPYNRVQGNGETPIGFVRKKIREDTGKPMGTLQEKYQLSSVPSLIVLNGQTGALIADSKIRKELGDKPEDGCEFTPEAPLSWLEAVDCDSVWQAMLGPSLLTPQGEKPTTEVLTGKRKVALLFSGEWCPWCRAFDPYFTDVMAKVQKMDPDDTEVVYMSVDADEAAMQKVTSQKPWTAVPYNRVQGNGETPIGFVRKKIREATGKPMGTLQAKYQLSSVPSLIVLDGQTGAMIADSKIRKELGDKPEDGCEFTHEAPASWLAALQA